MLRIPSSISNVAGSVVNPISSGIGIGANIISDLWNNSQNRRLARDQENFQRYMSDTAHQREVIDLKKAGLNPILSAGGGGSSTPAGTMPQQTAPKIDMPTIMSMYFQEQQLKQNQQRIDIEAANSAAGIANTLSDTDINKMKKVLLQKGMIRANLEGEASGVVQNMIKFLKGQYNKNRPPGYDAPSYEDIIKSKRSLP